MNNFYDYKRFAILYVDDEEKSLKYFTRAFEDQFRIFTAANAQDGLKLLEEHKDEIGLLMTDQRMPGEKGSGCWKGPASSARASSASWPPPTRTWTRPSPRSTPAPSTSTSPSPGTRPSWRTPSSAAWSSSWSSASATSCCSEKMSVLHNMMIADRIVSLGLLAAGLSHHIRNSLVAVKTFLDLAPAKMEEEKMDLNGLRNPDFWKEYYQNVQGQIEKINNMLKDLWTASEKPAFEFGDRVQLHASGGGNASRSSRTAFAAKNIQVENQIPDSLPALNVDKPKFCRLFELLLKDEIASLPAGSQITLTARLLDRRNRPDKQEIRCRSATTAPACPRKPCGWCSTRLWSAATARWNTAFT